MGATQAGFVAQVLGQILATGRADAALAARAYAEAGREPARMRFVRWT